MITERLSAYTEDSDSVFLTYKQVPGIPRAMTRKGGIL